MRKTVAALVLFALARPAHADGDNDDKKFGRYVPTADDKKEGDKPMILLMGGIDLGLALHPDRTGALVGAEVSVPYFDMNRELWGGLYIDTAYDTANSSTRLSLGPEFGWLYFGGDAGFVRQFGGDGPEGGSRNGIAVRPCLTIAIATLYFRHVEFLDDQPGSSINEIGLLVKYGFPIKGDTPTVQ